MKLKMDLTKEFNKLTRESIEHLSEEFNLSEWIEPGSWTYKIVPVKIIKEFIKQTIKDTQQTFNFSRKKCEFLERLEKRAGEKLLK